MTELERYLPGELAVPRPRGDLAEFVENFRGVAEISAQLARTRFVPQSLWVFRTRDGAEVFDVEATTVQVTAVILTGQEMGMSPMAALRSVDIIEGTPALRAVALRAVLLSKGHDIWVEEATSTRATVSGQRAGSTRVQSITWTMEDARQRNLAGKRNWRTQPRNMLIARATGDIARLVAADAIAGIPYTVEELEDGVDQANVSGRSTAAPAEPVRRTRRPARAAAAAEQTEVVVELPADEPSLDEQPPAAAPEQQQQQQSDEPDLDDATPDPISPEQSKLLHKLLRDRYGDNREDYLNAASEVIRRPIDSTSELTVAEASLVIDWLKPAPNVEA
jgi:hypothetical protein